VASYFIINGHSSAHALKGGWTAWRKAGFPVENK
jgi:3-mercaptopyruvate sulfurtransferase SseA